MCLCIIIEILRRLFCHTGLKESAEAAAFNVVNLEGALTWRVRCSPTYPDVSEEPPARKTSHIMNDHTANFPRYEDHSHAIPHPRLTATWTTDRNMTQSR